MPRLITGHKWPERFLALADHVGQWSKHERFKIGAVIVRPDKTIVSTGYNGAPRGVGDKALYDEHSRTIHAELNAILSSHVSVKGCEIFCSWPPCDRCACHIIQAGITRVSFMAPPAESLAKWKNSFDEARALFREAGVEVVEYHRAPKAIRLPATSRQMSMAELFDDLLRQCMPAMRGATAENVTRKKPKKIESGNAKKPRPVPVRRKASARTRAGLS